MTMSGPLLDRDLVFPIYLMFTTRRQIYRNGVLLFLAVYCRLVGQSNGQLFGVDPEGVRCYELGTIYTISCKVQGHSVEELVRRVIIIGLLHYTRNITDIETRIPDTAIYCTKAYDSAKRLDVYNLIKKGNITDSGNMISDCQHYIDGLRSGLLTSVTFTLRFTGEEIPLGCFYQLQGEDDRYYIGHGKSWTLHEKHVCEHTNVKPPGIALSTSLKPSIDIQLSTVVLSVGFIVLFLAVILLGCGYCQIQNARKHKLAGRIEDLQTWPVSRFPRFGANKSASEDLRKVRSTHDLQTRHSLPTQQTHFNLTNQASKPSVFNPTRARHLTPPFLPSYRTSREWFSALNAAHRGSRLASTSVEPVPPGVIKVTNIYSHPIGDGTPISNSRHTPLEKRTSSYPAISTQRYTEIQQNNGEFVNSPRKRSERQNSKRLSRSPQKVQSDVGSVKLPCNRSTSFDNRGRTLSLPSAYEKMPLKHVPDCSADAVWDSMKERAVAKTAANDQQLHGSTYMITADNMFEFLRAQQRKNKKETNSTAKDVSKEMKPRFSLPCPEIGKRSSSKPLVQRKVNDETQITLKTDRSTQPSAFNITATESSGLTSFDPMVAHSHQSNRLLTHSSSTSTTEDFHEYLELLKKNMGSTKQACGTCTPEGRQLHKLAKMAVIFRRIQADCRAAAATDEDKKWCSDMVLTHNDIAASRGTKQSEKPAPDIKKLIAVRRRSTVRDDLFPSTAGRKPKSPIGLANMLSPSIKKKLHYGNNSALALGRDRYGEGLEVKQPVSPDEPPLETILKVSSCHHLLDVVEAKSRGSVGPTRSRHSRNVVGIAKRSAEDNSSSQNTSAKVRHSANSANLSHLPSVNLAHQNAPNST